MTVAYACSRVKIIQYGQQQMTITCGTSRVKASNTYHNKFATYDYSFFLSLSR